jgi:UDP-N-acetylglucosamine transferase subunit ALG13
MIFLTVGTSFPFDRLVKAVDEAVGQGLYTGEIFAQVGRGGYKPINFESIETLVKKEFDLKFAQAEAIIAHAGMGTITMALSANKPILVVPRLKKYRELVNDHQLTTARRFEQLGHVLAVYDLNELLSKLRTLETFHPTPRFCHPELVAKRIGEFLNFSFPVHH